MAIELLAAGKALVDACKEGYKAFHSFEEKKEEDKMRSIVEELRRRSCANAGNCFTAEIGSEEDRLYSKMVAKGLLVRSFGNGYMLPEMIRRSGDLY